MNTQVVGLESVEATSNNGIISVTARTKIGYKDGTGIDEMKFKFVERTTKEQVRIVVATRVAVLYHQGFTVTARVHNELIEEVYKALEDSNKLNKVEVR